MQQANLTVKGMTCPHCVRAIETRVKELEGIADVRVDLKGGLAKVDFEPARTSVDAIVAAIEEEGYQVTARG